MAMKSDGRTPRICGNYRLTLNPRLRRYAATTMEPEDFMKSLHGCQYFSKIDLADAYLQIPLNFEARYFTTIHTPWEMYQYNFLPFGFAIKGLDGVIAYRDDVLIFDLNKKEHDARPTQLLERFAAGNVAIKLSKCVFGVNSWEWSMECKDILRGLIRCVTDRPVLAPFSPSKPTILITEASDVGIGAELEQEGCPVICISRLLNAVEKGYSQTQEEALAVFWAFRRLHKYFLNCGLPSSLITKRYSSCSTPTNPSRSPLLLCYIGGTSP
ncbi:unnamed protein product [Echinostoma caproni]|uniref:RT_RNaseH_2 domain-containing protein n=1 Tax=Echinostoma caproni TaxID=27848 RepID=A0A183A5E6_9TREM|nr:unnamed protein product [Echinostoma caproni]